MTEWCDNSKSANKRLKLDLRKLQAYSKTTKGDVWKNYDWDDGK